MVQQGQIDHLLKETGQIMPPPALVQQAFLQDHAAAYKDSVENPEAFWEGVAKELDWFKPWDQVFEWTYPTFKWFLGAKCNITYNALDRHLTNGNKNKAAFIFLGEDGSERVFTYGRLAQMVNRFANGLKSLGVKKGDRVVIYMPLSPEGAIAMLACARIGAVHSVVYAGFSVGSLRGRILDAQAKVVITADVGYRRGNEVDLKGICDQTVEDMDLVELNEAFAAQVLAVCTEWGWREEDKLNVNGSGISLGHPIAATGVRILTTLLNELERRDGRYGLETMCIGGGQGLAAVFERGVGLTQACGSAACAIVVAAVRLKLWSVDVAATVALPGGSLQIRVLDDGITMTGEAVRVFEGAVELPS